MSVLDCFKMPKPVKIKARTSSITNAFVNGIIPTIYPTEEEVVEALNILELDAQDLRCSYCGDKASQWDHLRPLIRNKQPTGYISEIGNLVPACGSCNSSKGNRYWRDWITGSANLSPKSRGISDLDRRINCLQAYEDRYDIEPVDFEALVGHETWQAYWQNLQLIFEAMETAQVVSDEIADTIRRKYDKGKS